MTTILKLAGATLAAALALSLPAGAAERGHYDHGSSGVHINAAPHITMAPHTISNNRAVGIHSSSDVRLHNNGGVGHTIGIVPNKYQNPGPGIVHKHFNDGAIVHRDRDHDGDGDHRIHRRHRGIYIYTNPYYDNYYDDGYYPDTCGYYWQRYLHTGNPKWKYRYYDCIG
jgi:hypothetical protein